MWVYSAHRYKTPNPNHACKDPINPFKSQAYPQKKEKKKQRLTKNKHSYQSTQTMEWSMWVRCILLIQVV